MRPDAGGGCGVSANEYSCAHGAQIIFGDLTPYLTYGFNFTLSDSVIGGFPPEKVKISDEFSLDTAVVMRDMRHLVNRLRQKLGNHTIHSLNLRFIMPVFTFIM
jgi:hypothetical protein